MFNVTGKNIMEDEDKSGSQIKYRFTEHQNILISVVTESKHQPKV